MTTKINIGGSDIRVVEREREREREREITTERERKDDLYETKRL